MSTADVGSNLDEPGLPDSGLPGPGRDARAELAPSDVRGGTPVLSQLAGVVGLALVVLGGVSVAAAAVSGRATLLSEGYAYLLATLGLAMMFVHALRDADAEVRRLYGAFAVALLAAAVVFALVPYRKAPLVGKVGDQLLPWGALFGFLSLAFFIPFSRNETDPKVRRVIEAILLWTGISLAVSAVVGGELAASVRIGDLPAPLANAFKSLRIDDQKDFLVGPGIVLGLLGVGFLAQYLTMVDPAVGTGRRVAVGLGVLGVVTMAVAVGQTVAPTVLYDGPAALRTPAQSLDTWKAIARGACVVAALGVAGLALVRTVPVWLKSMAVVFGVALAGVLVAGSLSKVLVNAPAPFLVPYGLVLFALGAVFGGVSLAVASESHFVVIARRELTAYFYSPTGYLILFGMVVVHWFGYFHFVYILTESRSASTLADPITQQYINFQIIGAITTAFLVPVLTMGLFAEERRTGTFEVLLTAPVAEGTVTLAKFFAAWLFFMLCWVPAGLYLVALRVGGGEPFDYRPALTFYLALGATGAAFVAIGTFFSSLTRNQIVAAVLTFATLIGLLLTIIVRQTDLVGEGVRVFLGQFDFLTLWQNAASGQLAVRAVAVQASVAAFFLYLTAKVLEARKWS